MDGAVVVGLPGSYQRRPERCRRPAAGVLLSPAESAGRARDRPAPAQLPVARRHQPGARLAPWHRRPTLRSERAGDGFARRRAGQPRTPRGRAACAPPVEAESTRAALARIRARLFTQRERRRARVEDGKHQAAALPRPSQDGGTARRSFRQRSPLVTPRSCPRETDLWDAIAAGRWPDAADATLRAHVVNCAACRDLALVAGSLQRDASEVARDATPPSSAIVWWRAQMRARQEAAHAADPPITVVHGPAVALAAA